MDNIYFIGAGGIGMAALERYFKSQGDNVAGYDRTSTELTDSLMAEGIDITFDESADAVPALYRDPANTLVVYTPAVPDTMPQLRWFRDNGFKVVKRAVVLGEVTRRSKGICFAGTHGKTTTSSMAAHILHTSKAGCNAFLGGVLRNYNSNFLLDASSPYSVIEADEYDRSFHHLSPYIAVITATDPDHLDIYGTEEAYLESFTRFTQLIHPDGKLIVHTGLKFRPDAPAGVTTYTYSRDEGDFHAANIRRGNGTIVYDLIVPRDILPEGKVADIELGVPVEINIENSIAAAAATLLTGDVTPDDLRTAIASFMGPKRRFEFHLREKGEHGRVIIDDYAHHPDELKASISSVKALYPDRRLTVAFQPHLYTRTRDFAPQFAEALSIADEVVLLDIYPAREEPIPGVTSKIIFDKISCKEKHLISKQLLTKTIKNINFDILLTVGAGDINTFIPEIIESIK
ncbi:MAG: UDP-N-acetylmuramate--L-alanine ligase [Bacteroides uniformis]|uniref:UDP-N-acetylmuramate--L-alanine ligase n=1 Tax=Bacteroides uniformis TaxID=820 RepID=A0A1Q6HQ50_BACUN|nr:MAG: UDP-N-acetylmuramate--L-alanine ligase [Bacteroides uniformis]